MSDLIPETVGKEVADLKLRQESDGIWRPLSDSTVAGAAQGAFPRVTLDISGQPRGRLKDIGCHRISSSDSESGPLTADDVGVSWKTGL